MHWLPRRGLVAEACRLIEVARQMEQQNTIGAGAVTKIRFTVSSRFRSLVASLVESTRHTLAKKNSKAQLNEKKFTEALIPILEQLAETLLGSWLTTRQTLRLSALELQLHRHEQMEQAGRVHYRLWRPDLHTKLSAAQQCAARSCIKASRLGWNAPSSKAMNNSKAPNCSMILPLASSKSPMLAWIMLVYEAILDHHAEYLDYNSTTTQSDRGELVYMFLDFLRLRVRYERIAWNLKPVMWAHEVLVRSGLENAAMRSRRSLSDRIGSEAEVYVKKLRELQNDYAMRMPTVADHILERFVQPMTIDRMRALVGPAIRDAETDQPSRAFQLLEQEAELLTRHPTGVGIDVPAWLHSLEEEVELLANIAPSSEIDPQALMTMAILPLSIDDINSQLAVARSQGRRLPHLK